MAVLSYSAHLSNDKSSIKSKSKLEGVAKHNLRKYKSNEVENYNEDSVSILIGTNNIVKDVKRVYKEEFEKARIEYNNKQKREDRKIKDYFEHESLKGKKDIAVEVIIQFGDVDYWGENQDKIPLIQHAYEEYLEEFKRQSPNLKIANAVIHYDENSPHIHVIAIPISTGYKNGFSKQVSKRKVLTKDYLKNVLQGSLRDFADGKIKEWIGEDGLKLKLEGRNDDYTVAEYKTKKEQAKHDRLVKENEKLSQKVEESHKELKETMTEQLLVQMALRDTTEAIDSLNEELKAVKGNISFGEKELRELARLVTDGPNPPTGIMSAKGYREKIVKPFTYKLFGIFKNIIDIAKSCFAELRELKIKYNESEEKNQKLARENIRLRSRVTEQEDRIDELEDKEVKLGYFEECFGTDKLNRFVARMQAEEEKRERDRSRRS